MLAGKEIVRTVSDMFSLFPLKSADSQGEIQLVNRLGFILVTEMA
jgi:hypothetical protein